MKIVYAVSALLVLSVAVLVLVGPGTGYAVCPCPGSENGDTCSWRGVPTATQAVSGVFNTASDTDPDDPGVKWCFSFVPNGGTATFQPFPASINIVDTSVQYDPAEFVIVDCQPPSLLTGQVVQMRGRLSNFSQDGLLVTRATIGPFPSCTSDYNLAINH